MSALLLLARSGIENISSYLIEDIFDSLIQVDILVVTAFPQTVI